MTICIDHSEPYVTIPIDRRLHIRHVNHRHYLLCHGSPPSPIGCSLSLMNCGGPAIICKPLLSIAVIILCLGKIVAERPVMALQITDMVLARTKVCICRWTCNLRSLRLRACKMCVYVINIHLERLRSTSEYLRTRHALVRPDGSEHDDVSTEPQLRMPHELPFFRNRKQFIKAEGRAE